MATTRMRPGDRGDARARRIIAGRYLDVAELAASEEGPGANNVVVGIAVLAGIAASDAICLAATGSRYAGEDHAEAARVLGRVEKDLGAELNKLCRSSLPALVRCARGGGHRVGGCENMSTCLPPMSPPAWTP